MPCVRALLSQVSSSSSRRSRTSSLRSAHAPLTSVTRSRVPRRAALAIDSCACLLACAQLGDDGEQVPSLEEFGTAVGAALRVAERLSTDDGHLTDILPHSDRPRKGHARHGHSEDGPSPKAKWRGASRPASSRGRSTSWDVPRCSGSNRLACALRTMALKDGGSAPGCGQSERSETDSADGTSDEARFHPWGTDNELMAVRSAARQTLTPPPARTPPPVQTRRHRPRHYSPCPHSPPPAPGHLQRTSAPIRTQSRVEPSRAPHLPLVDPPRLVS
jgi:hypothetical protein